MPIVIASEDLPRLVSTRDSRDRVDLVTAELFGLTELKADRITYHPGDTAAAHRHPGAKHFFFVLAGEGLLHAGGEDLQLAEGDVALVLEDEIHWFENPSDGLFEFIELWVPTPSETVWLRDDDR